MAQSAALLRAGELEHVAKQLEDRGLRATLTLSWRPLTRKASSHVVAAGVRLTSLSI